MVDSTNKMTGQVADTYMKVYHTDAVNIWIPNSAGNEGAAFLYVGRWNFFADDYVVVTNTIIQGSNDYQKCRTFSYVYAPDVAIPERYGMFCPLYGNIN